MQKKKWVIFVSILIFCVTFSLTGSAKVNYSSYIRKNVVKNLGIVKTGKCTIKRTSYVRGRWCKTKGIISYYVGDLNKDNKKEILIFYLKKKSTSDLSASKELRMRVYSVKKRQLKKTDDICLNERFDGCLGCWCNTFVYTYKQKKYIAYQNISSSQGCEGTWGVFSVNKNGKIQVKTWVRDPGYTSGIALYRIPTWVKASELSSLNDYYNCGQRLYKEEIISWIETKYIKALKKELSKYGLTVYKSSCRFNTKSNGEGTTVCKVKRKNSKKLFTVFTTYSWRNDGEFLYDNEYKITDYSGLRKKFG